MKSRLFASLRVGATPTPQLPVMTVVTPFAALGATSGSSAQCDFPHLGVDYMIHHLLSHSDTADWLKVNQFFLEQMAYIAKQLDSIQEVEYTALDNSMLMLCSSMLDGNHDANQLPVVMLGSGGGRIQGGRNLNYLEKPNRQMCRLYLSMMDKMGVRLKNFGDASEPLLEV